MAFFEREAGKGRTTGAGAVAPKSESLSFSCGFSTAAGDSAAFSGSPPSAMLALRLRSRSILAFCSSSTIRPALPWLHDLAGLAAAAPLGRRRRPLTSVESDGERVEADSGVVGRERFACERSGVPVPCM